MVSSLANLIGIKEMKENLELILKSLVKSHHYHLDFTKKESSGISGYFMEFTINHHKHEQHLQDKSNNHEHKHQHNHNGNCH